YILEGIRMELADKANPTPLLTLYNNASLSYAYTNEFDSAWVYANKALPLAEKTGNLRSAYFTYFALGKALLEIVFSNPAKLPKEYGSIAEACATALQYEEKALEICRQINAKDMQAHIMFCITQAYIMQNRGRE